jgi:glutathione S-transferase
VPVFEEDGFVLFETGAIVLHIGERCEALLPRDPKGRARATQWVIAALNSIEPFAIQLALIDIFYKEEEWAKLRRPGATAFVRRRLGGLANALGGKAYLEGERFTAGDLMMSSVLRVLDHTSLVAEHANLAAYKTRCESRPAFQRALAAQLTDFKERDVA